MRSSVFGFLLFSALTYGQASTSTVSGTVRDQSDAVLAGATLALTNTATNVRVETTTNPLGFYIFPGVIPGAYRLEATAPGMDRFEAALDISPNQKLTVDPVLKTGTMTSSVSVTDVTPLVNVTDSTLSTVIGAEQVEQIPRSDRTMLSLMTLVPGFEGGGLRFAGLRYGSTEFQLDGSPLVSRSRGYLQYRQPGLDSIQEVAVDNNNVSAKYNTPVAVIASTKSGTNQLHGSLFETHVNSRVGGARSRDASNALAPFSNRAQYGGSMGGPVWLPKIYDGRNRTFFFFSYEATDRLANALINTAIPTAAMRAGDFSGLVDGNGRFISIYDPWSTTSNYSRSPWNYNGKLNNIDPSRQSPMFKYLMAITPLPTLPDVNPLIASNWYGNAATRQNDWTWATRIDHRFSEKDVVYGRYSKNYILSDSPFSSSAIPLTDNRANRSAYNAPSQSFAASWVHTVSPTLFNEMLATVYRQAFYQNSDPTATTNWDAQLGLSNPLGAPQWPDINTAAPLSGTLYRTVYPNADKSTFYQIDDNATKIAGAHEILFGGHFRRDLINYLPQQEQAAGLANPVANWTALWDPAGSVTSPRTTALTGNAMAAFYLGMMQYGYKTQHGYFYERENQYALYLQDNWKVSRRLTLNAGVRWSAWPAMYEKYNNVTSFNPAQHAVVLAQPISGYVKLNPALAANFGQLQTLGMKFIDYQQAGVPQSLLNSNWRDFAPRLGFAYRLLGDSRPLVIRGGYSLTYFPVVVQTWLEKMRAGLPFVSNPIYSPDSAGYSPDGLLGYSLRNVPTYVAGANTTNVLQTAAITTGLTAGTWTGSMMDPNNPDTRVHDWNLTIEKEIWPKTLARVAWIGNHTAHLDAMRSLNPQPSTFVYVSNNGVAFPNSASASRPFDPLYGDIIETGKYGYANFSGAQFEVKKRFSNGFSAGLFYMISNAFSLVDGSNQSTLTTLYPASYYLNSQVQGLDQSQLDRLTNYRRDTTIPKRRLTWNWVAEVPVGRGKRFGGRMNRALDTVIGGWQLSGIGSWATTWFALPADQFPNGNGFKVYGHDVPVQDCRSGRCLSAYLYYNAYINPALINAPNGIQGVPSDYKPAFQNLIPFPSAPVANDPNAPYYGTNTVFLPLKDGSTVRTTYGGLAPLQNQYVETPGLWTLSASLFKSFALTEKARLRFQWDVFNPTNSPQEPQVPNTLGLIYTNVNGTPARSMQFTLRLLW